MEQLTIPLVRIGKAARGSATFRFAMNSKFKSVQDFSQIDAIHLIKDGLYFHANQLCRLINNEQLKKEIENLVNGALDRLNLNPLQDCLSNPISSQKEISLENPTTILSTKRETLQVELNNYGFFTLELVKKLPEKGAENLITLIYSNKLPYQIAMLEHIGFIKHLKTEHCDFYDDQVNQCLAKILRRCARNVKGNVLVLNPNSGENKVKYTAYKHKVRVEKDYQVILRGN
jgi:hypothetical protein